MRRLSRIPVAAPRARPVSTRSAAPSQPSSKPTPSESASSPPVHPALIDNFRRKHTYLRVSLTERCNLRCAYCMPREGVALTPEGKLLTNHEMYRAIRIFKELGVNKLRLTGGEPLLRADLTGFLGLVSGLGFPTLGVTTNGVLLKRHAKLLKDSGVTNVNISLDSLKPEVFSAITRRSAGHHEAVLRGLEEARAVGFRRLKLNCVVVRDVNDSELLDFVELTREEDLDVRFLEFMPFSKNDWSQKRVVRASEMARAIEARVGRLERVEDREDLNPTVKLWRAPGHRGRIGFMTSMSDEFCGTCNRLRLTADGHVKACLFGAHEVSMRDALRDPECTDEQVVERVIRPAILGKRFKLGGHGSPDEIARDASLTREMIRIGG